MPTLIQLHWLPVSYRIKFKLCCLVYAIHYDHSLAYLTETVQSVGASRSCSWLRSSSTSSMDYSLPRLRTKFSEWAFSHAGPATWNALPDHVHTVADPAKFRKLLKSHYFSRAFDICWFFVFLGVSALGWLLECTYGLGSLSNGRTINLWWYDMITDLKPTRWWPTVCMVHLQSSVYCAELQIIVNPNCELADLQNSRPAPLIARHNGDFHATHHCDRQTDVSFQDWLHGFPRLFADTSEHICLYFLVFLFFHFLAVGLLVPHGRSSWLLRQR